MYLTLCASTKYNYCITACLCVSCDSQNKEDISIHSNSAFLIITDMVSVFYAVQSDYL